MWDINTRSGETLLHLFMIQDMNCHPIFGLDTASSSTQVIAHVPWLIHSGFHSEVGSNGAAIYIMVDSAMAASLNGFCSCKLSNLKKTNIVQIMTKILHFLLI
jgi:hypothetical protein